MKIFQEFIDKGLIREEKIDFTQVVRKKSAKKIILILKHMQKDLAIKAENACPVDYAIKVNGVSKTFRIPHEKVSSLRGAFVSIK